MQANLPKSLQVIVNKAFCRSARNDKLCFYTFGMLACISPNL